MLRLFIGLILTICLMTLNIYLRNINVDLHKMFVALIIGIFSGLLANLIFYKNDTK